MKILYFKIALRNAIKNKTVSIAKIFGLSVSFAVILFAVCYIYYETSFDKHLPDKDCIYRVYMKGQLNLEKVDYTVTSPAMGPAMVDEIPEITEAVRMRGRGDNIFKQNGKNYEAGQLFHVDTNFFSFFSIPYVSSTTKPLEGINDLALAKSLAVKYFGSVKEALGQKVDVLGETNTITTIFDDLPQTSHMRIMMAQSIQKSNPDSKGWDSQSLFTYFKTETKVKDIDNLNFKLTQLVYSRSDEELNGADAKTWNDLKYSPAYFIFYMCESLTDIHFSNHKFEPSLTSNKTYVYGTFIIALLILIISTLNFLNLNLAGISMRLKEIGIQKANGAAKMRIFMQFIHEANLFWLISFVIGMVLFLFCSKLVSTYTGFEFNLTSTQLVLLISALTATLFGFHIIVNFVPAWFVSRKNAINLLKNKHISRGSFSGNNGFIFIQFVLSLLIVTGAFFVQKQIDYMVNQDRGYDAENVMNLNLWCMQNNQRESFIKELKKHHEIKAVSAYDAEFTKASANMTSAHFITQEGQNYFHTSIMRVDAEFNKVFNFELAKGRFFDKNRKSDIGSVIINEAAAREYRGSESLVGSNIIINGPCKVIGIVKDFNYRSLHHKIEPLVLQNIPSMGMVNIKFEQNKAADIINIVQKLWKEFNIYVPFSYRFHKEELASQYSQDVQARKLMLFLSIISIIIASVGLYAVSVYTISRKTKEIGIHKVNGAKVNELMLIINRKFLLWMFMALFTAMPISYYLISEWLKNFASRTPLSWWVFILVGLSAFVITLITVGCQSWSAANRNPVEALRYE